MEIFSCIFIDEAGLCQNDKLKDMPRNSPLRQCLTELNGSKCLHQIEDNSPVCQKCFNEPATMQNDSGDYLCSDCYALPAEEDLKTKRNRLIDEAANAAMDYARSCDIGPERTRAFEIRDTVLYSTMERT